MTYSDIETRILSEINRSDIQPKVSAWVNDTYQEILRKHDWTWLQATAETTTVTDQHRYELPGDFHEMKSVILDDNTGSIMMDLLLPETFDAKFPDPQADGSGTPFIACVKYQMTSDYEQYIELQVYPKPNSTTYTLRLQYVLKVSDLSGTSTPLIPASYHQILVYGGLELGFANLREYDAAGFWKEKKDDLFGTMYRDDLTMPRNPKAGPFIPTATYPSEYWKKWQIGRV